MVPVVDFFKEEDSSLFLKILATLAVIASMAVGACMYVGDDGRPTTNSAQETAPMEAQAKK